AIYQTTLLSMDVLDPILGAVLGIVCGCITTHILLRMMVLMSEGTAFATELADTFVVRQLIEFRGYHYFLEVMRHLGE
ncbi:MAG: hypothetical protein GTO55_02460, partial [Armatimonadetes bacterium]|nr:hypothetical protein [Armatimonadota bacterium]NIM23142.1 hypothetical protein [Armatimonadota bacterium]NIM67010.1 hypothetical protein [Armatimonadota bacterium]NIM75544.1 hypothetical protein [Armatimonadota bacterium]NIN05199.1 hypothetical protein [Armatimonadota bacterium]